MLLLSGIVFGQSDSLTEGNKLYNGMQYQAALDFYNGAVKDTSVRIKASYNIGNAQYKLKKYDEAIEAYKKSLAWIETDKNKKNEGLTSSIHHNIGNSLIKKKDYGKAVESFKNSLRLNPTDEDTRYNLQYAMEMKKQEDQKKKDDKENENKPDEDKSDNQPDDEKKKNQSAENQTKEQMKRMLDRLNKKEQEVKKKADKKGQKAAGSGNGKDW
jgi:tetratricopeptide (TPR) repeat protein